MTIFVCGVNHKTASLALRERLLFPLEKHSLYLQDLTQYEAVRDAMLLSTCNRSEVYCNIKDETSAANVLAWYCKQHHFSLGDLTDHLYQYRDQRAVLHIMRVALGLDSMVLGETQILGQMKEAFSESCAAGVIGALFNRLFQQVFSCAKEVRTRTQIGACPVSIASATIRLAEVVYPDDYEAASVLLVGAGETIQLILRHLKRVKFKRLIIANRTFEHAYAMANEHKAEIIPLASLQEALDAVDMVITATESPTPVITRKMVLARSHSRPLYIFDIAVPRDVEESIGTEEHIHLYSIDDLKTIIQQNLSGREHAAIKAEEMIKEKSHAFMAFAASIDAISTTISAYRQRIEGLCQKELTKSLSLLARGEEPRHVLMRFAHNFSNKLMHAPSIQLRQAAHEGRFDMLQVAQELFALSEGET